MPLKLTRTTTTTTVEEKVEIDAVDLSRNHGMIMRILAGLAKFDEDQVQRRALIKTASPSISTLDDDASLEDHELLSDQENKAKEADIRSDNFEYRKRKNRFIDGESPEDNRGRFGRKKSRKSRVIDEEEDEITFEDDEVIVIE